MLSSWVPPGNKLCLAGGCSWGQQKETLNEKWPGLLLTSLILRKWTGQTTRPGKWFIVRGLFKGKLTELTERTSRATTACHRKKICSVARCFQRRLLLPFTIRLSIFLTLARACDKRFSTDHDTMLSLLIKLFGPWAFAFYQTVFCRIFRREVAKTFSHFSFSDY